MKQQEVEVRSGLKFQFNVPETVEEFNKVSGRGDQACLEDAIDNNIYRTGLPDAWDKLAKAVAKKYDVKKNQKPHPNEERAKKGETVDNESDPAFVARIAAERGLDPSDLGATELQQLADSSVGILDLDLTSRRGKGEGLIPKQDLATAQEFLNADENKRSKALDTIAAKTGRNRVQLSGNKDEDVKAIALEVKAYRTWLMEQEKKSLLG